MAGMAHLSLKTGQRISSVYKSLKSRYWDGKDLRNDRVKGLVTPITPAWSTGLDTDQLNQRAQGREQLNPETTIAESGRALSTKSRRLMDRDYIRYVERVGL